VELVRRREIRERAEGSSPAASPDDALLIARTEHQRPVVGACCERALRAGVRCGMTIADARALVRSGGVRILDEDPRRDAGALESLARWGVRFSPIVAPDPPDGLLMNVTGCARIFRGENRLARKLCGALARFGFTARVAIAPTYGAAWAVARFGVARASCPWAASPVARASCPWAVLESSHLPGALDPLPVRALRLDDDMVHALDEVGIATIGELRAVASAGRRTLPSRFGSGLLLRLDQALGAAIETIQPVREREPLRVERVLDGPTTDLETLSIVARGLLDALHAALERRGCGVRRLDAVFERPRLEPVVLAVCVGAPTRDVRHLWSLLRPRMERMNLGDGVEGVELHAARIARLRDEQTSRWVEEARRADEAREIGRLCDTLANRIGSERVLVARAIDTHIPERAWELEEHAASGGNKPAPAAALHDVERPTLLLDPPESILTIAGAGDAPPWRITWRGQEITVTRSIGPERIAEAWWDVAGALRDRSASRDEAGSPRPDLGGAASRDYFRVQDQHGRWLWAFRKTGTNRWFMHGLWA
jgi:protein ImuB